MTQTQKRDIQGKYAPKRNKKAGLVVLALMVGVLGIMATVNDNKKPVQASAITATSTISLNDSNIEKQTEVYKQGLILAKQKADLDAKYKADSGKLESQIEANEKDQMSFTKAPLSK